MVAETDLRNVHAEKIFNSEGCLWLTRVLGPAPGVRFLLSSPIGTEKLQRGLYVFFFYHAATVIHLHNKCIGRPTLGLQLCCLDVIPTFKSKKKKKKYRASLQPPSEEQC